MLESKQYRLAKRMRWAARIIGLLAAGGFLIMLIVSGIAEALAGDLGTITEDIEGILLAAFAAIGLAGCIVSWWRERLASIVLILTAVGLGAYGGAIAGRHNIIVGLVLALMYLVPGVLLFNSWLLSRKTLGEQKDA